MTMVQKPSRGAARKWGLLLAIAGAVVVAGSRQVSHGKGKEMGISLYTPVIVKYRDAKTDARVQLEDLLR